MSDGFLFLSKNRLKPLLKGRLPFRVIEQGDLFYHLRMEYETHEFVRYDRGGIYVLPKLSELMGSFDGDDVKFSLFRLQNREGEFDLPKISQSFSFGGFWRGDIRINTFYDL